MLAEIRLLVAPREARLMVRQGDDVTSDELWKFGRAMSRTEAKEIVEAAFSDCYDLMNFVVHGTD
jgi:hypothetical protein